MNIAEIISPNRPMEQIIGDLKKKTIRVRAWSDLEREYDARLHPVNDRKIYRDKMSKKGEIEQVTRFSLPLQRLATKRMTELIFGIPIKRVYHYDDGDENAKRAANIMEAIFQKNRIDSINLERGKMLYAACECVTLWYSQEMATQYAGEISPLKLRCKNYSPMKGDTLYPLFDEYDDLIALSVEYTYTENNQTIRYFDTYTADEHVRWCSKDGKSYEELREKITLQKITGVYISRQEPIWEDQSQNVYEAEWTLSRNGNYIRKNAKPIWVVCSDDEIKLGKEEGDNGGRAILQYPAGATAGYATWPQAIESIKYQVEEIKRDFFMMLQLPDMSMENMKATPMSGEARKMMFIDAQLKVLDEKGIWLEAFDREINVVRAFMKLMYPSLTQAIETLQVENVITPYTINDEGEQITNLMNATGGKAIMSQKTAIRYLDYCNDVDKEMQQIADESAGNIFEPTL